MIPAKPAVGDWPDMGAAIVEEEAILDYRPIVLGSGSPARMGAVLTRRVLYKILTQEGLSVASVSLRDSMTQPITRIAARVVNRDQESVEMHSRNINRQPVDGFGIGPETLWSVQFTVPGALVGGLVEYTYEQVFSDPLVVPTWTFARPYPVLRSQLILMNDPGIQLDFATGNGTSPTDVQPFRRHGEDGRERLVFVYKDLAPLYAEPDQPHPGQMTPWVAPTVRSITEFGKVKRYENWNAVAAHAASRLRVQGSARAVRGTPVERLLFLREKLRVSDARGLNLTGYPNVTRAVQEGTWVTSEGATSIIMEALDDASVAVYSAFAAGLTDPVLRDATVGLYAFGRVLAAVDLLSSPPIRQMCEEDNSCDIVLDRYLLLDPTCGACRLGELPPDLWGSHVLIAAGSGTVWYQVPIPLPNDNTLTRDIDLELDVDGEVEGSLLLTATGSAALELRRTLLAARGADARRDELKKQLYGEESGVIFRLEKIDALTNPAKPLVLKAHVRFTADRVTYEVFRLLPADLAGVTQVAHWRSRRRLPCILPGPAWSNTTVNLRVPVGYKATLDDPVKLVSDAVEYAAGAVEEERGLRFSRRFVIKQLRVEPAAWPDVASLRGAIMDVENAPMTVGLMGAGEP